MEAHNRWAYRCKRLKRDHSNPVDICGELDICFYIKFTEILQMLDLIADLPPTYHILQKEIISYIVSYCTILLTYQKFSCTLYTAQ